VQQRRWCARVTHAATIAARCWSGTGLDRRVMGMLVSLVETSLAPDKLKIYLTGVSRWRRCCNASGAA
jgi:hypothetical protein